MSSPLRESDEPRRPIPIESKAAADLQYIRRTMERASSFTAVPGWGGVGMGVTALIASVIASRTGSAEQWLATWIGAATVAAAVGTFSMVRKARAVRVSMSGASGRRFVLSLLPPMIAGGILSAALYEAGYVGIIPGLWLLLYGAGVVTGGTYSVGIVPVMGLTFMVLGVVALFLRFETAQVLMGIGFGGIHVVFGWIIARRYGG